MRGSMRGRVLIGTRKPINCVPREQRGPSGQIVTERNYERVRKRKGSSTVQHESCILFRFSLTLFFSFSLALAHSLSVCIRSGIYLSLSYSRVWPYIYSSVSLLVLSVRPALVVLLLLFFYYFLFFRFYFLFTLLLVRFSRHSFTHKQTHIYYIQTCYEFWSLSLHYIFLTLVCSFVVSSYILSFVFSFSCVSSPFSVGHPVSRFLLRPL